MSRPACRSLITASLITALLITSSLLTASCAPAAPTKQSAALTPYHTLTPSPTPSPFLVTENAQTALPTPTPFIYRVQEGDTMGALAEKFGVPLEALIAANPGVSPNAMPIGAELRIPADANNPTGESTPTPVPFVISQIHCYPTLDGGMWCLALARNDLDTALENLSARLSLHSPDGGTVAAQEAIPPLNAIPPHSSLPLAAFFPPPAPVEAAPRIQILSAAVLAPGDPRYLPVSLANLNIEIAPNGRTARVTGEAALPAGSLPAKIIWVAAVAYDAAGSVVGFRRWEGSGLQAGGSLAFELTVASLGSRVKRVEVFAEARP